MLCKMKATVKNLENKDVGEIDLLEAVFGVKPRRDILTRMVNYQLAKRRSGNHKTKGISEIMGTTDKPWAQKGTGRARQGSLRSPQFRKGGMIFGPWCRDHAHDLPKKVRRLAFRMALASKPSRTASSSCWDRGSGHRDQSARGEIRQVGLLSALIIDGANLDPNFAKAAGNIPHIDVLPEQGANVYDILRRDILVLTKNAVEQLQERLKPESGKRKTGGVS